MATTMKRPVASSISRLPRKRRLSSSFESSPSAEIIGGHGDLLTEILLLLPAKSLLRFKSVSNQWNSLISGESFCRRHLLNHGRRRPETQHSFILGAQGRSQFFICHPTIKKLVRFSTFPCTFPFTDEHVKILQSCHGLLLLECAYSERGRRHYYVFNPITKQFKAICNGDAVAVSLIFDPSKSEYYRVTGIWRDHPNNCYRFYQYDSGTKEWTSLFRADGLKFSDVISCNNRAYFITNDHTSSVFSSCVDVGIVVSSSPKQIWGMRCWHMVESNGHLHCIDLGFNRTGPCFSVSEMIDNKWSARKKTDWYQLKRVIEEQKPSTRSQIEFLGMIREERMEDSMFLVHVPGQIIIFRLRDEACEVLVDYRNDYFYQEGRLQFEFKNAHPFVGTFASV